MKIPKKILERRKHLRISEELPFQIGHQGYEIKAKTINISEAGALCNIDKDIPILTQLSVALSLPSHNSSSKSRIIKAKGVIVRKQKDLAIGKITIAIYFSDMSVKDHQALDEFIQKRTPKN